MYINFAAVIVATILQFIAGAIWYMPLFGKLWGKIHGFELLTEEDKKKAQKDMMPYLAVQFAGTFVTTSVLALFVMGLPAEWNVFGEAAFLWIGFVVPTQVSAVIFGGTPKEWMLKKIGVMAGASFVCLLIAATIIHLWR